MQAGASEGGTHAAATYRGLRSRRTVSINAQERIFVGDRPINLQLLEDTVRGMMEGRMHKVVYLRADESIRYGKVITVIDKLKSAGVELVGFAYELPQEKARR